MKKNKRPKLLALYPVVILAILTLPASVVSAKSDSLFRTKFAVIHYADEKDINDFIWKLGGSRSEFSSDIGLASSRIDVIVERVVRILDIWPGRFKMVVYLHRGKLRGGGTAYFDEYGKAAHISVDFASDTIFAHEVANSIIYYYYGSSLPSKVRELLLMGVDKYLWIDTRK